MQFQMQFFSSQGFSDRAKEPGSAGRTFPEITYLTHYLDFKGIFCSNVNFLPRQILIAKKKKNPKH